MTAAEVFQEDLNMAIREDDKQNGAVDLDEELDLGSTTWNDADFKSTEMGVDVFDYAVPFTQSPDSKHGNEADKVDDFVQSSADNVINYEVSEIEQRPPSRIFAKQKPLPNTSAGYVLPLRKMLITWRY